VAAAEIIAVRRRCLPYRYHRLGLIAITHSWPLTGARGFENEWLDSG
jgi:hypothetical protein